MVCPFTSGATLGTIHDIPPINIIIETAAIEAFLGDWVLRPKEGIPATCALLFTHSPLRRHWMQDLPGHVGSVVRGQKDEARATSSGWPARDIGTSAPKVSTRSAGKVGGSAASRWAGRHAVDADSLDQRLASER